VKLDFTSARLAAGYRRHLIVHFIGPSVESANVRRIDGEQRVWMALPTVAAGPCPRNHLPGLLSGSDPGSSSGDGGGSGSGRGGIGVGSSGRGCGGCWGMAPSIVLKVRMMQQSACPIDVYPRTPVHPNISVRRVLSHPRPLSYNRGSHNSTNRSHLSEKRLRQPLGRCGCFTLAHGLRREKPAALISWEAEASGLPLRVHKPSPGSMRRRHALATVGLAPTAARSAPTTRTDGSRYRPLSP